MIGRRVQGGKERKDTGQEEEKGSARQQRRARPIGQGMKGEERLGRGETNPTGSRVDGPSEDRPCTPGKSDAEKEEPRYTPPGGQPP